MWNLKKDTNELICRTETDSQTSELTYGYPRGGVEGYELGGWDWHRHTLVYGTIDQWGPAV